MKDMEALKIEIGDTVRISEDSEYYNRHTNTNPRCEGVYTKACREFDLSHYVEWDSGRSNYYKLCDLTLVKKGKKDMKEFTKSDLKTGMFVKLRNGDFSIVLGDIISGEGWGELSNYNDDMLNKVYDIFDIVAVYERIKDGALSDYLEGQSLKIIWERTEQTEAQKEMEVLQEQAKALQEQITKLQGKLIRRRT